MRSPKVRVEILRLALNAVSLIAMCVFLLSACTEEVDQSAASPVSIPVRVLEIESENTKIYKEYVSVMSTNQVLNQSFKASGRIKEIYVEEGFQVEKGQMLAVLESTDITFAVEAARADLISAQAQMTKSKKAYAFAESTYEDMTSLFEQGAISQNAYDQALLNKEMARSDYGSASEVYKQAEVALRQKEDLLEEAVLYAPFDGQIVQVLVEAGEVISAGYPVLVLNANQKIVTAGVTQKDIQHVREGMPVDIAFDSVFIEGHIEGLTLVPDASTRTYQIRVAIGETTVPVGAVGSVYIPADELEGVRIPISAIISENEDYVYVVKDGTAIRRTIAIDSVLENEVFVQGLSDGEFVVIEGMKNLKNLSTVHILED